MFLLGLIVMINVRLYIVLYAHIHNKTSILYLLGISMNIRKPGNIDKHGLETIELEGRPVIEQIEFPIFYV